MVFPFNLTHFDVNNVYNAKLDLLPLVICMVDSARKGTLSHASFKPLRSSKGTLSS